jgi:hypothetical protein
MPMSRRSPDSVVAMDPPTRPVPSSTSMRRSVLEGLFLRWA